MRVNDFGWHLAVSGRPVTGDLGVGGVAAYPGVVVFEVGAELRERSLTREPCGAGPC